VQKEALAELGKFHCFFQPLLRRHALENLKVEPMIWPGLGIHANDYSRSTRRLTVAERRFVFFSFDFGLVLTRLN
jgi:hypothetical protein